MMVWGRRSSAGASPRSSTSDGASCGHRPPSRRNWTRTGSGGDGCSKVTGGAEAVCGLLLWRDPARASRHVVRCGYQVAAREPLDDPRHAHPTDPCVSFRMRGDAALIRWRGLLAEYASLVLVLLLLVAGFSLATNHFFTVTTLRTVANQVPDILLVATGMTFVIIAGGIDLSVGSILALSGAVLGVALADWKLPLGAALVATLATGAACGALNGLLVTTWALPSFIVTLGMLEVARGGAYLVTASQTKYIGAAVEVVDTPVIAGLTMPFLLALGAVAAAQFVLTRTV